MKNQALFSSKDKSEKLKCHLLQFLFGAFRVNKMLNQSVGFMVKQNFESIISYSKCNRIPQVLEFTYCNKFLSALEFISQPICIFAFIM